MSRLSFLRFPALALALLSSAACEIDFAPRAEAREEWKKTYTVDAGAELTIENGNGTITVRPGSGPDIEIVATRIAKAGTEEAAKTLLAETAIQDSASGSRVSLSSRANRVNWGGTQYQVNYEVRAPAGVSLTLAATNGTIDVTDWQGRVEMSATNGSLEARGLSGEVKAETTNGKIDIGLTSLHERGVTLETTNGRVLVELPRDAKGRVVAHVTNGAISVDGLNAEASPSNSRRRYEGTLNGGGNATVSIDTTNGAITVRGR